MKVRIGRCAGFGIMGLALCALLGGVNLMGGEKKNDADKPDRAQLLKTFVAEFVEITPGEGKFPKSFQMGSTGKSKSEQPVHRVTFGHTFSMARYEVPQNLYEVVMGTNPSKWKGPRNSVEMMTYRDAGKFCSEATKLLRDAKLIAADEEIRLPSEAEWEYCCRAGTNTTYSFGDSATKSTDGDKKATILDAYGWHTGNASGNDPPVGALKPNAWGLYDMHGYLWELVADDWHHDYTGALSDGRRWGGDDSNLPQIIRGGSWRDRYELLRSSTRRSLPDHVLSDAIGFRCVKAKVRGN